MITADHGPAVSGAHNTIVCARAGKDLVSSLVSGLLTIVSSFFYLVANATFLDMYFIYRYRYRYKWRVMRRRLMHTIFRLGFACGFDG